VRVGVKFLGNLRVLVGAEGVDGVAAGAFYLTVSSS
jgi:hypothetical protein